MRLAVTRPQYRIRSSPFHAARRPFGHVRRPFADAAAPPAPAHGVLATMRSTTPLPRHVAVIMDGNGRWATERGLPRHDGHRRGADAVRRVVQAARELGIPALTLYAFSS